eukprot:gb/GECH01003512.1/.p1 GENE.gb/GECH01003512.1/~~gb/GECH01003512.1/.p1  ORF type:complete len:554 (+),score=157.56 gb/GECH01003512.1/:1-1662(+)
MSHMLQPSIILLKEGTDTSQGKAQLISNIDACISVVDTIKSTLGPRGMDKLINDGNKATISNDGATIMNLLEIEHPAAKTLVDIAKSQDSEVGDGTTSVVVIAGELLKEARTYIEEGVHPQIVIRGFRQACNYALKYLDQLAEKVTEKDPSALRDLLAKCAATSLNSKLIGGPQRDFFARMAVDAVMKLDDSLDLNLVGVKKVHGGSLQDSFLVDGVAFKKTFSYAGFEQQPKHFKDPKILLLNMELELKAEKENAEIRLSDPKQYQQIVEAEWKIIYEKLDNCVKSGAKVVLSKLAIGDLATQYFADRGVFCAGRVPEDDLKRVSKATGGSVQTTVTKLIPEVFGTCASFEERQVGNDRYNILSGCPEAKSATILLRGGGEHFIDEAERSLHDALMIVRRTLKHSEVVAGGGAIEMELSKLIKEQSNSIQGKTQLIIKAFAKALEVIPRQLADNAGIDSTDILTKLRQKHSTDGKWYGVDIKNDGIFDCYESFVWEPKLVRQNALSAATQAACLILSVDETIKNPQSQQQQQQGMPGGGQPRGGMSRMGGRR